MKQIDLFSATELRDVALEQVLENTGAWKLQAKAALRYMWFDRRFTGEDIRRYLTNRIGIPHHSGAWGSITRWAIINHIIAKTGTTAKMRAPQSHARENPVYIMGSAARCPNPQNNL